MAANGMVSWVKPCVELLKFCLYVETAATLSYAHELQGPWETPNLKYLHTEKTISLTNLTQILGVWNIGVCPLKYNNA